MSDMILEKSKAVFSQQPFRDSRGDNTRSSSSSTDAFEDFTNWDWIHHDGPRRTNPNLESKVAQDISHGQCPPSRGAVWGVKKMTWLIWGRVFQAKQIAYYATSCIQNKLKADQLRKIIAS